MSGAYTLLLFTTQPVFPTPRQLFAHGIHLIFSPKKALETMVCLVRPISTVCGRCPGREILCVSSRKIAFPRRNAKSTQNVLGFEGQRLRGVTANGRRRVPE